MDRAWVRPIGSSWANERTQTPNARIESRLARDHFMDGMLMTKKSNAMEWRQVAPLLRKTRSAAANHRCPHASPDNPATQPKPLSPLPPGNLHQYQIAAYGLRR